MITVDVKLPGGAYPVVVGDGARHLLADHLPAGVRQVAVVTQAGDLVFQARSRVGVELATNRHGRGVALACR